jgi:hypothetical protein
VLDAVRLHVRSASRRRGVRDRPLPRAQRARRICRTRSFGHGAWFGLAAYAAALSQKHWFPGQFVVPALFAIAFVALASTARKAR